MANAEPPVGAPRTLSSLQWTSRISSVYCPLCSKAVYKQKWPSSNRYCYQTWCCHMLLFMKTSPLQLLCMSIEHFLMTYKLHGMVKMQRVLCCVACLSHSPAGAATIWIATSKKLFSRQSVTAVWCWSLGHCVSAQYYRQEVTCLRNLQRYHLQ